MSGFIRVIDTSTRSKSAALLQAHWKPSAVAERAVAERLHYHPTTIFRWEQRLQLYGSLNPPIRTRVGRPRRIYTAAKQSHYEYVRQNLWIYQDQLMVFLEEEYSI